MKINQIIVNELSEGVQPGVAEGLLNELDMFAPVTTYVRLANGEYVAASWRRNQDLSGGNNASFIDIKPLAPNVAKQLGLDQRLNDPDKNYNGVASIASGGGVQSSTPFSDKTIDVVDIMDPKFAKDMGVPDAVFGKIAQWGQQQAVAENNRPFRGVGGAFNRGDDERHDLDPTDWYIVKDGEMFSASIYPRQVQQAIAQGFSRTQAEARARADSQGVAEGYTDDIETTRQFKNAIAGLKARSAIDKAKDGAGAKYYYDGAKVTPQETARRAAERKAKKDKKGVAEAGNANSGRRGPDYRDNSPVVSGRVEHLPQGLRHRADASRYGGTEPDVEDDRLLSPAQRHRLHQAVTPDDWFDESKEKIAGRHDPDEFDNMIGRLKKLAGAGPLKTVWDPARRVYRNVPHAVQPPQQPKKATQ